MLRWARHDRSLFWVILLFVTVVFATTAHASRPGGGSEGPDQCTVMGEVTQIKDNNTAVVRLKQTVGSTTYIGCSATGAETMAEKNTAVTVPLNIQPAPTVVVGDVVFVNIRNDKDPALETFAPGEFTLQQIQQITQLYFEDRVQREQMVYAIRTFMGVKQVVEQMVPQLTDSDKEKRLSAALLLIILADARQPVPPDALQQALRIGLMESRESAVGASIKLYPGDRAQVVNVLIGMLHDKEVVDPFATIVAMGEIGPDAARALPDAIDRINDTGVRQLRSDGDVIFGTAVEKMKAEEQAAKIFLAKADAGQLKDKTGPLAKGMCRLQTDNAQLAGWCREAGAAPFTCKDARAKLDSFIAAIPNACTKDEDCDGYYFPIGGPDCPSAQFLPKSAVTGATRMTADKLQAVAHVTCAKEWANNNAVCSPPPIHAACREGKCVEVK